MSYRPHAITLAAAVAASACTAPDHLRAPPLPAAPPAGAAVELSVEVKRLEVFDESRPVTPSPALAQRLADYLRTCSGVSASAAGVSSPAAGAPTLAVEVAAEVQSDRRRTWALDVIAAATLSLFPLTPEWGRERVMLSATVLGPDGTEVWHHQEQAEVPYETWLYSWYRTDAAQQALATAWAHVFGALASSLCEQRPALNVALRPPTGKVAATPPPTAPAPAATSPRKLARVVVLPPRAGTLAQGKALRNWVGFLRELVAGLEATRRFQLATVEDTAPIVGHDRARELAACADSSCAAEVGSTLAADYVVTTIVDINDNGWHAVKATVLDMKTGTLLGPVAGGRLMLDDAAAPLARDLAALLASRADAPGRAATGP